MSHDSRVGQYTGSWAGVKHKCYACKEYTPDSMGKHYFVDTMLRWICHECDSKGDHGLILEEGYGFGI